MAKILLKCLCQFNCTLVKTDICGFIATLSLLLVFQSKIK